jgi:hypothetical protein
MMMQSAGPAKAIDREENDPFAQFSLDALVSATARLRPESFACHDRVQSLPYGMLAVHVAALARQLSECGLKPGETIILTGGAEASLVVALIAALRGGYEPALAPLDLEPAQLAAYARALNAAAIIGPSHYGDFSPAETFLATAASVDSIRLVGSYGPQLFDGTLDLSPAACLRYATAFPDNGLDRPAVEPVAPPRIMTFDRGHGGRPVFHRQSTLIAAGLDFAARAKVGRETPILCTLPPTTFAGLVAGPFAALLSGAVLHLHGPFNAQDFVKTRDRLVHPHLVAPVTIASELRHAGVMDDLASAILVSRLALQESAYVPEHFEAPCAIIDLYAIEERAAVAEQRREGLAQPPAQEPHFVGFDESRVLTIATLPGASDRFALHGAAVTAEA